MGRNWSDGLRVWAIVLPAWGWDVVIENDEVIAPFLPPRSFIGASDISLGNEDLNEGRL